MCTNPVYLKSQSIFVNCRQCPECRLQRAKEWACRLHYELKTHKTACFITLTYNNNNNNILLNKKHTQDFIKRLRYSIQPQKIKYFLCGEYGDHTYRPHYHIIIFGYDFPDKIPRGKSKKGFPLYMSPQLSNLWDKGYHTIQDTSIATCIYTALYTAKSKFQLPSALQNAPEFNLMSQGLGVDTIISDYDHLKQTDAIWIDGQKYTIPQAVLKKLFIEMDKNGCIVSKHPEYVKLKEERLSHYKAKYPEHAKLNDTLVKAITDDEKVKLIKTLNAKLKAERDFRNPLDDKIYSQEKKGFTKTL